VRSGGDFRQAGHGVASGWSRTLTQGRVFVPGGEKLIAALREAFRCRSSGSAWMAGSTVASRDCLLKHGAARCTGVDVGSAAAEACARRGCPEWTHHLRPFQSASSYVLAILADLRVADLSVHFLALVIPCLRGCWLRSGRGGGAGQTPVRGGQGPVGKAAGAFRACDARSVPAAAAQTGWLQGLVLRYWSGMATVILLWLGAGSQQSFEVSISGDHSLVRANCK